MNVELDGTMSWSGEVHLIVAGASKEDLRAALSIEKRYRSNPQEKLLRVEPINGLVRAIGYATKYYLGGRVAYIAKNDRQARNKTSLKRERLGELAAWHASLKSGERIILFGCRRNGRRLLPLTRVCVRGGAAEAADARKTSRKTRQMRR